MQTTLENNRPKFRNKILSKYCETAVFVGNVFLVTPCISSAFWVPLAGIGEFCAWLCKVLIHNKAWSTEQLVSVDLLFDYRSCVISLYTSMDGWFNSLSLSLSLSATLLNIKHMVTST